MKAKPALPNLRRLLMPFGIEAPAIEMEDMVLDSREVAIHKLFVAVTGHRLDGRDFIPQAISLGAKAILAETEDEKQHGQMEMREQSMIIQFYRLQEQLSALAAEFYGHPADAMQVIGVTGTNGKTSTVQLCAQLATLSGTPAGTIGTLGAGMLDALQDVGNTTPDAISMHRLLNQMHSQGAGVVALEASSHALVQHRIKALKMDAAIFTNLTRDHLDYHGDMNRYAAAKRLLLKQPGLKHVVLNQEDSESRNWLSLCGSAQTPVFFGLEQPKYAQHRFVIAKDVEYLPQGTRFRLDSSWGQATIQTRLLGPFNVLNLLGALAAHLSLGRPLSILAEQVAKLNPVPGRLDVFKTEGMAALVVDYAHTPDALEQALKAIKAHARGQVWCVFGCGGDRDKGKRPLMGQVAQAFADRVILTNDNSRSEDPAAIARDILEGCSEPQSVQVELDRKKAIKLAVEQALPGDLILLAGKGHETYQLIGDQKLDYDEREFAASLVAQFKQTAH
ncbi:UDP-N-acetylmuramoyl-L-alanyl-D-glutamate--2,6-diaminopimelate ligase [Aliiglaciecola sp. CAU 1673]|uniref:UDP-N-acetylmuramoyl-L-alanyl-D-glutamate--2, 6-diaminopimelate ligase n=1 Tax=Aliiglaciecola sp. CAU 1673 TaxID=3032595 RepID=UPI0023DA36DD|nr:UDP-N-acetylmuramoyl-L-alanyl-D-glutamate--2,6-diaminopimelate ligase [Aliiglaciecola sp. CAU 1673]MDF2178437.1 UDP-N-acetylmuramoyl-L-alanyl-D-glutamate--2,6-diaminopimelate ligase [Aliiglaciecola sp. CAU 1673]